MAVKIIAHNWYNNNLYVFRGAPAQIDPSDACLFKGAGHFLTSDSGPVCILRLDKDWESEKKLKFATLLHHELKKNGFLQGLTAITCSDADGTFKINFKLKHRLAGGDA